MAQKYSTGAIGASHVLFVMKTIDAILWKKYLGLIYSFLEGREKGIGKMPIYEWQCPKCGQEVEQIATKAETLLCGKCHIPMVKLISAPAIVYEMKEVSVNART